MFDVFPAQFPSCQHSVLFSKLGRIAVPTRTAHLPLRRPNWVPHAAMFSNEKTEKEVAAHFAMFNRKGSADGKAESTAGRNGQIRDSKHGLPLFTQYNNLPPDGKTLTEEEETCNPEERTCKVPMHVWERKCYACSGTGFVRSFSRSRRGRSSCGVCPTCIGMGYVRCASSKVIPDLNNGTGPHFTLLRPKDDEDEGDDT